MSDYRRLISYIYAYEGGVKGKNIGFAKIEVRGEQCRIYVSVKKVYVGSNDIAVYLLSPADEIFLGRIFIRGGNGEFRMNVSSSNVEGSGCAMEACYGLTIHDVESTWQCYTTIWEDAVTQTAEVTLGEVTSENIRRRNGEELGEAAGNSFGQAEDDRVLPLENQPVPLPISEEIERELEAQEKNVERTEQRTETTEAEIEKTEMKKTEAEKTETKEERAEAEEEKAEREEEKTEMERERAEREKRKTEMEQERAGREKRKTEMERERAGWEKRKTEMEQERAGREREKTEMKQEKEEREEEKRETETKRGKSEKTEDREEKNKDGEKEEEKGREEYKPERNEEMEQGTEVQKMETRKVRIREETDPQGIEIQEEIQEEIPETVLSGRSETGVSEMTLAASSGGKQDILAVSVSNERNAESVPVDRGGTEQEVLPEPEDTARLQELDRLEQEELSRNHLWNRLQRRYTKVLAFDYDNGCEILSIKPQDIGLLPREIWIYGNNSFLLHGYYNYRHLILAKLHNPKGAPRYLLGVPGHYFSNEKYMASMFGFPHFVLARRQPENDGRFGYWYTDIRL